MKKNPRILAAILLAAMLIPTMFACGGDGGKKPADTTAAVTTVPEETAPTHDANGFLLDGIPEDIDFNGTTVNILKWNHYESKDFNVEEENGEILNDALYNRNRTAEERLNVVLEFPEVTGRDNGTELMKAVQATVMSGLGAYDALGCNSTRTANCAAAGLFINLYNIDYLDFDKPWWSEKILKNAEIAGKVYFATGDITVSSIARIMGLFVNMDMFHEFNPSDDLLDIVIAGDWTLDKMLDSSKGVYADLNANGSKDAEDRFAYVADSFQLMAPFTASGLKAVVQTEDGGLKISESSYGERANLLVEKMINFMHGGNDGFAIAKVDDRTIFNEYRCMFFSYVMRILDTATVRDYEYELSFIPWPKFDAADDDYIIPSSSTFSAFAVPLDVKDPSLSGAVLETLASEGYRQLTPALFEVCYKVKYNNDVTNRQAAIFDIMRENRQYDIVRLFMYQVAFDPVGKFGSMVKDNNASWASTMAANLDANQKALDDLVTAFAEFPS